MRFRLARTGKTSWRRPAKLVVVDHLVEHYDASMIWVVCKLIQEDWVRAKRQERRAAAEGHGPDEVDSE